MTLIQGIPDPGEGLRLHLNENTQGCSPRVAEAVRGIGAEGLALYPDYKPAVLETAAHLGVDPDWLVLTNGLDEGILLACIGYLAPRTPASLVELGAPPIAPSGQPEAIVVVPAFESYAISAKAMGARVVAIPSGPDFAFPLEAVLKAVTPNTRLIFVNTPHNPSGVPIPRESIRRVAERAAHAVIFVDEAYHDFAGEHFLDEGRTLPNVIVGRTFSKAYGLAGIRVGLLVAPPALLQPLRYVMPVFNLNVAAIAALRAAIADRTFMPWYVAQVQESKVLAYATLDRLGLRYWKSSANFVLIDGGSRARALIDGLRARGIFVRDRTADPHTPTSFRLTTGVVEHTKNALAALEELCAAP